MFLFFINCIHCIVGLFLVFSHLWTIHIITILQHFIKWFNLIVLLLLNSITCGLILCIHTYFSGLFTSFIRNHLKLILICVALKKRLSPFDIRRSAHLTSLPSFCLIVFFLSIFVQQSIRWCSMNSTFPLLFLFLSGFRVFLLSFWALLKFCFFIYFYHRLNQLNS